MKLLQKDDIYNEFKKKNLKIFRPNITTKKEDYQGSYFYLDLGQRNDYNDDTYFITNPDYFISFVNTLYPVVNDPHLEKILQILHIYNISGYTIEIKIGSRNYSFKTRSQSDIYETDYIMDVTFENEIKACPSPIPNFDRIVQSNLCQEIMLSNETYECILGRGNIFYSYVDAYNKQVFPAFKKLVYKLLDIHIHNFEEFNDEHLKLIQMVKI